MSDVLVIGAGPAGAVAARELARRGAAVVLAERATFPRAKVCGCCLNQAALAALDAVGLGHIPAQCGAIPLTSARLAAGRSSAVVRLPGGAAVSRGAFDAALVAEAVAAGATFRPGTMVRLAAVGQRMEASGQRSGTQDGITILATGLTGTDSRPDPHSRIGAGVMIPADAAPDLYAPGTIYMATGRGGYVGLVRVENGQLDAAAALDPAFVRAAGGLGPAARAILGSVGWPVIPGIESLPWKGTPALTRRPARVAGGGWFAVGDAAGYVEPFTGEGLAWAIASAAALAPIARRAAVRWDDRLVTEWERVHARIVGRRQALCRVVARVLRSPTLTRTAVRVLSVMPFLSRPVVSALNRPAPHTRGRDLPLRPTSVPQGSPT